MAPWNGFGQPKEPQPWTWPLTNQDAARHLLEYRDSPPYMLYAEKRRLTKEPAMTMIELPDEQAAALKAKAAAQGYTLEVWLKKLAEGGTGGFSALDWSQCPAV